ncbi:hypothetical protein LSCM1_04927 [Leishmania martiniquensis]|uniref:Uncharacterized protein n=1 Tax=Leishmania martiniquensis TaxID=1580590 RepID=A0A836KQ04_9TRYP|nr:hypothetical protein LSCM1_04927 [Leishmania martiniquensis]
MSSLIRCTDDLLHQKAVQSSHYERLERQLLNGERCRRAAVLALRQRVADVTRRGKDVVDLRRENHQLADQIAQHALQLAALQCRNAEVKRRESAAVERLQDGIRSFSGHPARVVIAVQASQAQRQLHCAGRRLSKALQHLWGALRVRRQALVFVAQSTQLLSVHATSQVRLTGVLHNRAMRCSEMHEAACLRRQAAAAVRLGPLMKEQHTAERALLALQAQMDLLNVYAEALGCSCETAKGEMDALSVAIDHSGERLSAMQEAQQEKAAAVTEKKRSLAAQQAAHTESSTLQEVELLRTTDALSAAAADEGAVNTHVAELQRLLGDVKQHTQPLARRVYALAFLLLLCECEQQRLSRQCLAQREERARVELELSKLRTWHDERLERLRAVRAAAANAAVRDAHLMREAQDRKATVDLEGDEWRLLYAQLVRDACRARADASAAAAKITRRAPAASKREERGREPSALLSQRKRARAERQSRATTTAASRRQRAALEAVDALTVTASQHSSIGHRASTHADEEAAVAELTAQEHSSGAARMRTSTHAAPPPQWTSSPTVRPSYRLTSVKHPAVEKKPIRAPAAVEALPAPLSGKKRKANERVAGGASHAVATAAARASAMSPFTIAVSEGRSSSSFSSARSRKSAAAEADSRSDVSDIRLSSPSPSPRCPPERCNAGIPPIAAAHPLPRPVLRRGCVESSATITSHIHSSALTSALAACTPRGTAIAADFDRTLAQPSPFASHFTGNCTALPNVGGTARLPHKSQPRRATAAKAVPPARRRAPLLALSATDVGEDLFADIFS